MKRTRFPQSVNRSIGTVFILTFQLPTIVARSPLLTNPKRKKRHYYFEGTDIQPSHLLTKTPHQQQKNKKHTHHPASFKGTTLDPWRNSSRFSCCENLRFLDDGLGGPFELVFDGKSRYVGRRTSWVPLRCVGLTGEREDDLAG